MKKYISIIAIVVALVCGLGIATYAIWDNSVSILEINSVSSAYNVKLTTTGAVNTALNSKKLVPSGTKLDTNDVEKIDLGTFTYSLSSDAVGDDVANNIEAKTNVAIGSVVVSKKLDSASVQTIFTIKIYNGSTLVGTAVNGSYVATTGNEYLMQNTSYRAEISFTNPITSLTVRHEGIGLKSADLTVTITLACTSKA